MSKASDGFFFFFCYVLVTSVDIKRCGKLTSGLVHMVNPIFSSKIIVDVDAGGPCQPFPGWVGCL